MNLLKKPYLIQGVYYLITGLWPLIHIDSFIVVSGPKTDLWLVKTVGVLVGVIGLCLLFHAYKRKATTPSEIIFLGLASALGFIFIDIYYTWIDRIWDVYLWDALGQFIIIVLWIFYLKNNR